MSEKKLTEIQIKKIEELKREFKEKAMQIPEPPSPHNILDNGSGPFRELEIEFKRRVQEVLEKGEN